VARLIDHLTTELNMTSLTELMMRSWTKIQTKLQHVKFNLPTVRKMIWQLNNNPGQIRTSPFLLLLRRHKKLVEISVTRGDDKAQYKQC